MLLIKNGRLVDLKSNFDGQVDILVAHDKIVQIADWIDAPDAQIIDASGFVIAHGLVDIHVYF